MTFQKIWEADMKENGILPLIKGLSDNQKDPAQGYVIVDMNPQPDEASTPGSEKNEITVFKETLIPDSKQPSYDLFIKLHDNYDWKVGSKESTSPEEQAEVNDFLQFAIGTKPMQIAREYAESNGHLAAGNSDDDWKNMLKALWFKLIKGNSTSYFEHVFLGEQGSKRRKLGGHHFWYHYLINDGPFVKLEKEDSIVFIRHVEVNKIEASKLAEVITIEYSLEEIDNQGKKTKLIKNIGGFFVGTSPEGLLALGTVAFLDGREHIPVELNGEKLDITVFRTQDEKKDARTFYPVIKEAVPAH
ncbi:hypothetical protein [Paenibacillus sp. Leaf72]|uniref:hypothetical protein n=1 Tax=Paenibacillus sp. Leaf72 TaxID=1736234 RepID=UPI0006F267BD|nr:hypothetical protein [Paenibacillus sp. Leaf72]KQO18416.1 hypothetical protein ASF12_07340 [Paenibacillus sp. Leaf72]